MGQTGELGINAVGDVVRLVQRYSLGVLVLRLAIPGDWNWASSLL